MHDEILKYDYLEYKDIDQMKQLHKENCNIKRDYIVKLENNKFNKLLSILNNPAVSNDI